MLALLSMTMLGSAKDVQKHEQKFTARITYYSPSGKYGSKVAWQKTKRAQEGVTVAAHPNLKFGTKLSIPQLKGIVGDGEFVVQDRGPAVTARKASKGKAPVIDVFVSSSSKIAKLGKSRPAYMTVIITDI